MFLNDSQIIEYASRGMIHNFEPAQVVWREGDSAISFGVSSYGYDCRLSSQFYIADETMGGIIDPKNFNRSLFRKVSSNIPLIIPAHGFVLGSTVEYFRIPRDILVICLGKSTYARCGLIVNVTPLEPEWEGNITIEISNTTPLPAMVYPNEGIAQLLFAQNPDGCEISYADRRGKYQGQRGVTLPRM